MKKTVKRSVGLILLLAITTVSAFASTALKSPVYLPAKSATNNSPSISAIAAKERHRMLVCSSILNIYGSASLSGNVVAVRNKGDIIEASTEDGLIYEVYSSSGIVGYCRAGGLVYTDTKIVAKLPVQWEIDADSATKRYTELTDVNEFAYARDSAIKVTSETVLVQREILLALYQKSVTINRAGYTLSIEEGYGISDVPEECPASPQSGALIRLSLTDTSGSRVPVSSNSQMLALIEQCGLIQLGDSDIFYSSSHEKYMQINISVSDLVYVIYE